MSELKAFIKKKTMRSQDKSTTDWNARKNGWNEQVCLLFDVVERWLNGLELVEIQRKEINIHEDGPGTYKSHSLEIKIGDDEVSFIPAGMSIIGSYGRVDLVGMRGMISLVLLEKGCFPRIRFNVKTQNDHDSFSSSGDEGLPSKDIFPENPTWYFFDRESVRPSYMDLTEDNLGKAFERVMSHVDD